MKTAHRLEFFTDEDGDPWACFAWGDLPPETITPERICEAAAYYAGFATDDLCLEGLPVQVFWIRDLGTEADAEYAWHFCRSGDAGALQVTGVRFQ